MTKYANGFVLVSLLLTLGIEELKEKELKERVRRVKEKKGRSKNLP